MSSAEERELLEWAAKAAGYTGRVEFNGSTGEFFFAFDMSAQNPRGRSTWSPRHDDGDALRLAVKLHMGPSIHEQHCMACAQLGTMQTVRDIPTEDATRLAIFRAAAVIGKAMP